LATVRRVVLRRINRLNSRLFSRKVLDRLERKLEHAGRPSDVTAVEFVGLQELGALAVGLFGLFLWATVSLRLPWVLLFFVVGWFYPHIWLRDQLKKRQHQMIR